MMEKTITLAAGTQHLLVADIPMMIAKAVTPDDITGIERITSILKKSIPDGMPNDYDMAPLEPLTVEDWVFLEKVCALHTVPIAPHAASQTPQFEETPLPPLRTDSVMNEIDLSEWGKYVEAIAEYKKDWKLFPRSNSVLNLVAIKHYQHLMKTILDGELIVFDQKTHLPVNSTKSSEKLNAAFITVDGFKKYARLNCNISVILEKTTDCNSPVDEIEPKQTCIPAEKYEPKLLLQEKEILFWLHKHNYDPSSLPKPPSGKSGIKKICRDDLLKNKNDLFTVAAFKPAWERLRKTKQIQDAH